MEKLLLLDVSYGTEDIVRDILQNPLVMILFMAVAGLLLYFGIRAIRRELKKKKEQHDAATSASETTHKNE